MRDRPGRRILTLTALALVSVLCATHAADVAAAFTIAPAWILAAAALHVGTLVLRSEAWRLSLASAGGDGLTRGVVHGANAAAFVAGAMQSQAAMPARVAVLCRTAGGRAPRPGQICVADVPIFALELVATALLLAAGAVAGRGQWWVAACTLVVAVVVLLAARLGTRAPCPAPDHTRARGARRPPPARAARRARGGDRRPVADPHLARARLSAGCRTAWAT